MPMVINHIFSPDKALWSFLTQGPTIGPKKRKEERRKQRGRGVYVRNPRRPELLVREIIYSPVQYELITCNSIYSLSL